LDILTFGKQAVESYTDKDAPVDKNLLTEFLLKHWRYLKKKENIKIDIYPYLAGKDSSFTQNISALMAHAFPLSSEQEIGIVVSNPIYENVRPLIEEYVDEAFLREIHTGSRLQMFSPYLSMSVGGPIDDHILTYGGFTYMEMVIPDTRIIVHPEAHQVEKEVLVKEIRKDEISRVFLDNNQLHKEVLDDKTGAIGQYLYTHERNLSHGGPIDQWKSEEKTEDCLPAGLVSKLTETD
jgi:hypothetical protein